MKYVQFKNTMDSYFQTSNNTLNNEYLFDQIELVFMNTREIQEQIENKRVRAYNPPFMALLETIKSILSWENIQGVPTTKQIEKYFNEYGYDYKTFLEPLTNQVIEIRQEL